MDDLLREFLTETSESLDTVDNQLVRFEQDPNNAKILDNIFRLVHTIKGTCGFLGLPRLEALAHAAENVLGKVRDGEIAVRFEVNFVHPDLVADELPARREPIDVLHRLNLEGAGIQRHGEAAIAPGTSRNGR